MASAQNGMSPGLPFPFSPGDLGSAAIDQHFHVFPVQDLWSESARDRSFDSQPVIEKVRYRAFDADGTGVENRASEPQPVNANPELPSVIVTAAIEKFGIRGWRRRGIRRGGSERRGESRHRRKTRGRKQGDTGVG